MVKQAARGRVEAWECFPVGSRETGKCEIRMSNFETSPNVRNPKVQNEDAAFVFYRLEDLRFELVSDFNIRASSFPAFGRFSASLRLCARWSFCARVVRVVRG
jgi:hypothetical protein